MSKSKRTGWLNVLAPAIGMVAGVMVVAGIYLLDPAVVDLGFALDAGRTWLVGVYLIAAGAALVYMLAWPKGIESGSVNLDLLANFLLGQLSHFVYGFIEVAIGVQALFGTVSNWWAALLLVPGLLSLAIAFSDDDESTDHDEAEEAADGDDGEDNGGEADEPESGQEGVRGVAWASLVVAGLIAAMLFAVTVWIGFAVWIYTQLKRIIIDGGTIDAAGGPMWEGVVRALPTLVPLALGLAFLLFVIFLISSMWPSRRGTADSSRDLNPAETAYVEASAKAVRAYARAQGYDRNSWIVSAAGFVSLMGMIGLGAVVMFGGIAMLETPAAHGSYPLALRPDGASAIVGFFAFILLGILPVTILSRLSRRYSERAGWHAHGRKDYAALKAKLIAFVRARRLSTASPINPGEFLHAANVSGERYYYGMAAVVAAVALLLLHRDVNAVDVLTADSIEVADYWTLAQRRYSYGDVRQVELRCFLTGKGEPTEAYELQFKDGRALDIYRKQAVVEAQFEAYEAVDAKLVALGVPFVPGPHQGLFKGDERGYDPACVETLAQEFPEPLRERVRRLFHLEGMRAVEDIWPWDRDLAQARWAADKYAVAKSVALYTKAIASGRLTGHLLAVAYRGRGAARENYESAYGIRDSEMLLALRDYQKVRDIEPSYDAYAGEGATFTALGAYDEATAAYRKALELDQPHPHWSLIGLSRVELTQGRYDAALQLLDEALRVRGE